LKVKIGGYAALWGVPMVTGEVVDEGTELGFNDGDGCPVILVHGRGTGIPEFNKRVIGQAASRRDDVGLWAEVELDLKDDLHRALYELAEEGAVGWSIGVLRRIYERDDTLRYSLLWIAEFSLVPTPAQRHSIVRPLTR